MTRPVLLLTPALLLWPAASGAVPVTIEQPGRITSVEGPELVGGVALYDPHQRRDTGTTFG